MCLFSEFQIFFFSFPILHQIIFMECFFSFLPVFLCLLLKYVRFSIENQRFVRKRAKCFQNSINPKLIKIMHDNQGLKIQANLLCQKSPAGSLFDNWEFYTKQLNFCAAKSFLNELFGNFYLFLDQSIEPFKLNVVRIDVWKVISTKKTNSI